MADKVPVKATFDSAGDADGLSEFVSGDTIPITHGGTGLAAVGSAGQILRTNSSANAIEWGAAEVLNIDGMTDGTSVTLADTDKLAVSDGGTEKYINLSQVKTYVGPLSLIDEDDMATNSATRPPSQQSVKAYVDDNDLSLIDEDDMASNSATRPPSQQSVKAYVDNNDLSLIDEDDMATNSATRPPSQQSTKAYVDSKSPIGKQSMWIPAVAMNPTATNGCAGIAALDSGGNTGPDLYTLDFAGSSANEHAQFSIAMPSYWNESTVTFKAYWTSETTDTDGVVWELKGVALADNDSLNTAFGTGQHVDDANIGTAKELHITAESSAITIAGSPAAGELCYFNISRLQDDGSDTASEDAKLIGIKLFYTVDDVHEA